MNTDDQLVTIRWIAELARYMSADEVRRVAATDRTDAEADACREWVAANPLPPKLSDLPAGSIVKLGSMGCAAVQPDGSLYYVNSGETYYDDQPWGWTRYQNDYDIVHVAVVPDGVQS